MKHQILRLPDVLLKTSLARSTLYSKVKDNTFPQPVPLGIRTVGWVEQEVSDWIESQIQSSREGGVES